MTRERCSRLWEIEPYRDGRLGEGDAKSFERHLRACEACRTQLGHDERLRELARALPDDGPTELSLRRLRARVLRDAATGVAPPTALRGLRPGIASLLVLVVLVLGTGVWALVARKAPPSAGGPGLASAPPATTTPEATPSTQAPEALAGAVVPAGAARWSQARAQGFEHVVLDDGMVQLHVRPQVAGERFVVMVPDGELEVRGTTFEVSVAQGATTRVHVDEGVVEVRLRGRDTRRLEAGETWSVVTGPARPTPAPVARPAPTASAAVIDGGAAYAAAIGLLRDGHNDEAAAAFHAFVLSQPGAPQTEDASFLEAVALSRAGRSDAAALAAEHHLAAFPASFHRKEAAILLARAAQQRGECGKARALLARWAGQGQDADVQSTLRACEGR
ncbi:MAG: FecR domain-containing protein [Polyangiaceae bacterium]